MNQSYDKSKASLSSSADVRESGIRVGYDLALSSLLNMLDEIDPLTASEMRARLGVEEDVSDNAAQTNSGWHHPTFS